MRSDVLDLLRSSQGEFLSGEEIATKLGVTRSAVWKQIEELRLSGYNIHSQSRRGYILRSAPDKLIAGEIKAGLATKLIGKEIIAFDSVDSTNTVAKNLAREGAVSGTIVVAEEQGSGRGRLERLFYSPPYKGIWTSVILRPAILPKDAPKFTLLSAVAVAEAMAEFNLKADIKWPNDILYEGKKLVGILTEMSAETDRVNYITIGVGINVNMELEDFPEDLRNIATSLAIMKGDKLNRVKFLQVFLTKLDKLVIEVERSGFASIMDKWRAFSITLGQRVKVINVDGSIFHGIAEDIDSEGALLVRTDHSLEEVLAGDVSIRPSED